jgi:hypothetical protein
MNYVHLYGIFLIWAARYCVPAWAGWWLRVPVVAAALVPALGVHAVTTTLIWSICTALAHAVFIRGITMLSWADWIRYEDVQVLSVKTPVRYARALTASTELAWALSTVVMLSLIDYVIAVTGGSGV